MLVVGGLEGRGGADRGLDILAVRGAAVAASTAVAAAAVTAVVERGIAASTGWILRDLGATDALDGIDPAAARIIDGAVQPQLRTARTSDLVIAFPRRDARGVRSVVVEIQLAVRRAKPAAWALYWAAEYERTHGGEVWLVVITAKVAVARWAQAALARVIPPAGRAIVIGPGTIAPVEDVAVARRDPVATLISAVLHAGTAGDERLAPAIAAAYSTAPSERGILLIDDVLKARLTRAALRALEQHEKHQDPTWLRLAERLREDASRGGANGGAAAGTARAAALVPWAARPGGGRR